MAEFQVELESAKQKLTSIDESIKTLTGRAPLPFSPRFGGRGGGMGFGGRGGGPGFRGNRMGSGGDAPFGPPGLVGRRRSFRDEGENNNANMMEVGDMKRRRTDGPRDFGDFDTATPRPSLASSVIMPVKEEKTRDEAITETKKSEKKEQNVRNRRMFGMLMGTLQRFRKDERQVHYKDQEKKQKEVESKLEAEKTAEFERRKKEKEELMNLRKEQEFEIKRVTRKRNLCLVCEREINHLKLLQPFIQTQCKPPLFYSPAKHTLRTIELQKKTERRIEDLIAKKREKLQEDLQRITEEGERYRARFTGESTEINKNGDRGTAARKRRSSLGSDEGESDSEGEKIDAADPEKSGDSDGGEDVLTDNEDNEANTKPHQSAAGVGVADSVAEDAEEAAENADVKDDVEKKENEDEQETEENEEIEEKKIEETETEDPSLPEGKDEKNSDDEDD